MRKTLWSVAVLMIAGAIAFAQAPTSLETGSCPTHDTTSDAIDYNNAYLDVCVDGDVISQVAFTVTTANITLDTGALQPGSNFTIRYHVFNNSDRAITVTDDLSTVLGTTNFAGWITSPGPVNVPANGDKHYDIQVSFPNDATGFEADLATINAGLGDTVQLNFNLFGEGADTTLAGQVQTN